MISNLNKLSDYYNLVVGEFRDLFFVSSNFLILPLCAGVIAMAFILCKLWLPKITSQHYPSMLLRAVLFPLLTFVGFALVNIVDIILSGQNQLLFFLTYLALFAILIRIVNSIIGWVFAKYSYGKALNKAVSLMLWITAVVSLSDSHHDIVGFLDAINFHLGKSTTISVWDILRGVATIIITIVVALLLSRFAEKKISTLHTIDGSMQQIFIRIAKIAIFILSFMVTMPLIGIDVTALSVFGGALGVGLGFGLQKIASNFLSGFIILLDRSIKVGDRLIIDNNGGIVTKITTRYVVMARFDGTETLIPNETFITSSIQNQSYSSTSLRFEAVFSVSDSSDITLALKLIGQAVQSAPNAIADKAYASISRLIDNGIEIKGYFWLPDPKHFTEANNYIYIKVLQDFKQNNIATPAPSTQNIKMLN